MEVPVSTATSARLHGSGEKAKRGRRFGERGEWSEEKCCCCWFFFFLASVHLKPLNSIFLLSVLCFGFSRFCFCSCSLVLVASLMDFFETLMFFASFWQLGRSWSPSEGLWFTKKNAIIGPSCFSGCFYSNSFTCTTLTTLRFFLSFLWSWKMDLCMRSLTRFTDLPSLCQFPQTFRFFCGV